MSGLTVALREAGIVDQDLHWSAPAGTALVGCGDYLDRGADSRGVVALLRRLQGEAAAAGGVAVLARGNHEHLLHGLITLREKIAKEKLVGRHRARHADPNGPGDLPVPEFGPHDLEPTFNPDVWSPPSFTRDASAS